MSKASSVAKVLAGVGLGVGIGVLIAPDKGSETRKKLKNKLNEMVEQLKNIDADEIKEKLEQQIEDIKRELADLDKEKVLKIAKEKGKAIVKKCDNLYKTAVKKGTPVLEKAADDIRLTAIDVLNNITEKLEKKGN